MVSHIRNAKADERKAVARKAEPSLVERGIAFARAVRARGDLTKGLPADKEFIDSLYEGESGDFGLTDIKPA